MAQSKGDLLLVELHAEKFEYLFFFFFKGFIIDFTICVRSAQFGETLIQFRLTPEYVIIDEAL